VKDTSQPTQWNATVKQAVQEALVEVLWSRASPGKTQDPIKKKKNN
jgi:hypothetical protein